MFFLFCQKFLLEAIIAGSVLNSRYLSIKVAYIIFGLFSLKQFLILLNFTVRIFYLLSSNCYYITFRIQCRILLQILLTMHFRLPVSRRHFECAVVNDCVYIIGGVGNFRIVQENIFFYDFKSGKYYF